jgi:hypothetical protein
MSPNILTMPKERIARYVALRRFETSSAVNCFHQRLLPLNKHVSTRLIWFIDIPHKHQIESRSESFSIVESIEIDRQVFYPKNREASRTKPVAPVGQQFPAEKALFWKVRSAFQSFIDVESM